jgi:exo-beta-1,3-glucanase (GH17 family)
MSSIPEPVNLNNHHRDTLLRIFQHPTSHNIEWHAVASLLSVVGTIEEHKDGKFEVRVGSEVIFMERPRHKDIDIQQVVDLRRLLTSAGYKQEVETLESKGTED